ncbi:hypothetical protein J2S78_002835 [Salibacterium salarium]|uniref:hypothetical protein n=1 Tax=Salibacterium salarium TaxID=284579 RepID=UPI0027874203|nr:hypothetical protein [Salibacterium salarium]MDQ0300388.1 hypothetical protein [Salibacterium salarium]
MEYKEYWMQIYEKSEELNSLTSSYWNDYSNIWTWQFWVVVFLLVFPLILLYFIVDRKRVFELFFFGYTVHVLWTYTDIILEGFRYFVHTYFLTPLLPLALNMTASALPVGFLLLYQYCTNNEKNFYLYTLLLSGVFAFGFATIEEYLGLLEFEKGMNQLYIFLIDIAIAYIAYWGTKLILKFRVRDEKYY